MAAVSFVDFSARQSPADALHVETSKSVLFWKPCSFGNWTITPFKLDGVAFNCAEQAFMYRKAMIFGDKVIAAKIQTTFDPKKHKALGRKIKNFHEDVWQAEAQGIMYEVLYAKFSQDDEWKVALLQTGQKQLIEASPYDAQWGVGLTAAAVISRGEDPSCFKGKNWLGIALMKVRNQLQKEEDV